MTTPKQDPLVLRTVVQLIALSALVGTYACNEVPTDESGDVADAASGDLVEVSDVLDAAAPTVGPLATGAPCETREECGGGATCLDWPDGYCSISPCRGGVTRCPRDGICDIAGELRECLAACETGADCRDGYGCVELESGRHACLQIRFIGEPTSTEFGLLDCWPVPPGGVVHVPVEFEAHLESVTVVAHVPRGSVRPLALIHPNGEATLLADVESAGYRISRTSAQVTVPLAPHLADSVVDASRSQPKTLRLSVSSGHRRRSRARWCDSTSMRTSSRATTRSPPPPTGGSGRC